MNTYSVFWSIMKEGDSFTKVLSVTDERKSKHVL